MKRDAQITGNSGLYYACYHLSQLGWNVMPTARNARGIDIVAYTPDATSFIGIQVKALSKCPAVPLGGSLDKVSGDFWIIVNQLATEEPMAHIMLPDEVRHHAVSNEKDGRVSYWLSRKYYELEKYRNAWDRIVAVN